MLKLELSIPDDVIYELKSTTKRGNSIEDRLRLNLAIGMIINQEMSLAKCAQIAGHNLGDFMIALNELGIPSVHYSEEMLADDLKFADEGNSCMKVGGAVFMEKEYRTEDICYLIVKVLEFCKEAWGVSLEDFIDLIEKHNIPKILWEGYDSFKLDTVEVIAEELTLLVRSS